MNIWFKYKEGEPVEISFKGKNVNALKKQIKTKLKNQLRKIDIDLITLRAPGNHENLSAEMLIDEKFATSYNKPVFVETVLSYLENYQEKKSFYIQCYDDEGVPLNKFELFTMNDRDFREFLRRVKARGLENIDDDNEISKVITSLDDIQANKYYRIKYEMTLAVKDFVDKKLKSPAENFPNRVMHDEYKITEEKIDMFVERLKAFPKN
ncbi:hypothetical protein GLOIN_2v1571072 [Rhizophagus clarus]|uniref:Uncharacterized protein n=1 Tax=Rhizophagus clarus TaxID=94130 RepID=A0A8H3R311_9GLOM|nr:hypothetical protein GLOIN_2v1571072 [Rhizophagus clarus]